MRALAGLRGLGSNRRLVRVQLAWAANIGAHHAETVALLVVVLADYGVTGVGLLGLLRTVPAAVAAPVLLSVARRVPPVRVLIAALLARAGLLGGVGLVLLGHGPLWLVLLLAAVDSAADAVYWPAQASLLPRIVTSPEELTAANVATAGVEGLGSLLGPAAAAALLALVSQTAAVFALVVITLVAGALMLSIIAHASSLPTTTGVADHGGVLAGLRALLAERDTRLVVSLYLVETLTFGALGTLIAVIAVDLVDAGNVGIGLLTGALGVGGVIGSIASLSLAGRRLAVALDASLLVWGAALLLLAVLPGLAPVAAGLICVAGVAGGLVDVSALTLLQRIIRQRDLGQALAAFEGLWWATFGIGAALAAVAVDQLGLRGVLAGLGLAIAAVAVLAVRAAVVLDGRVVVPAAQIDLLRGVPMFAGQAPLVLERLAFDLVAVEVPAGAVVLAEGEAGDRFYVVEVGTVLVDTDGGVELGPGQWFGEIALLHDVPRTATVRALTDVRLQALEREEFLSAVTARSQRGNESAASAA